jgi:UDPglucose 6-dehydrogenase
MQIKANKKQKNRMYTKLLKLLNGEVKGKRVAVLGLSFKHMTDDVRESASIEMIKNIINNGGIVKAYDPEASENMKLLFPDIDYFTNWQSTVKDVDAVAIMTEWHEFRGLDLAELKSLVKSPVILDTRNLLSMDKLIEYGFIFDNIGRKRYK